METLTRPLEVEMEVVRNIITNTDDKIAERIKWNAPGYYYNKSDFLTFNPRATKHIHLVFNHPDKSSIRAIRGRI